MKKLIRACLASVAMISLPAAEAQITDTNAPTCVEAKDTGRFVLGPFPHSLITVRFSEPMDRSLAEDSFNYSIPGFNVIRAVLDGAGTTVTLELEGQLLPGTSYQVATVNAKDLAGNTISPNPSTLNFRSFVISGGFARREFYFNIGGLLISDLRNSSNYPNSPDLVNFATVLESPRDNQSEPHVYDNYGTRVSGFIIPPVSGEYNFFMSSDDQGEFWLSTDANPLNLVLVCHEPVANDIRDWTGTARRNAVAPENRSSTLFPGGIPLVAGQFYYFEALMKEGGGNDNLAVTWQLPGAPLPAPGSPAIPGAFLAVLADSVGVSLTITQQPQDQLVVYTNPVPSATFCVGVSASTSGDSNPSITYQWSRDNGGGFTPISGANGSCVTVVPTLADNGARFRCAIYIPGATVTSSSATLTVVQPNTAPQFTKGPDMTVLQDSGPSTTPSWATGISPSTPAGIAGESNQVVHFIISNGNPSLFSVQPAISPSGTLTFTPAPGACGRANLTVVARDNGGTAVGGVDTSAAQTNSIRVTCVNNCPTAVATVHPALSIECVGLSNVVIAADNSNACVVLDGTGSSDPDGDALSYSWTVNGQFNVNLDPAQEPNGGGTGSGSGSVTLSGNSLALALSFSGLSANATAAHIHGPASAGINAAVLYPLNALTTLGATAGTINGTVTLGDGTGGFTLAQQLQQLRDGQWYINIHSPSHPGGEIRGQLLPTAQGVTVTNCLGIGAHEVCLTVSDGMCSDTKCVTVEVISPCQAVGTLILTVETSSLPRGRQRPLIVSLKAACASFDDGELTAGIRQLAAFQNKVRAQVTPLDATLAQQLIDCTQAIIDGVAGPDESAPERDRVSRMPGASFNTSALWNQSPRSRQ
jgi:hypothetical protein